VVAIPAAKQRTLLACLLLRAGELVTVDELAEAIWGDGALPAEPRRVVQIYVTRLRQLLGTTGLIPGLAIRRELGDAHCEAESLRELGESLRELGRLDQARAYWRETLAIFERLQPTDAGQVRALLAELPAHPPG
jgi:Transcriptional regulatory protein, C terminal